MLQEDEKTSTGGPRAVPAKKNCEAGRDSKDREVPGKRKADDEDLELYKGAEDMPELKDEDQELWEDEQISLDLGEPPLEILEYARRELGETDEVKCQMLQELRDMIYGKFLLGC